MGTCKEIVGGKTCGAKLIQVFLPVSFQKRTAWYCKNPKCSNYFKCSCGKEFGKHFTN